METTTETADVHVFVYDKRRYAILILLGLLAASNYFQHYEYNAISDTVANYYGVSLIAVNCSALVYNIGSVLFLYPICKFIQKYGFKNSMIFMSFFNALGCCIKCLAYKRNDFWLIIVGQIPPAFVSLFHVPLPAILGANWFKSEHVGSVIGACFVLASLGPIIAFLSPALIINYLHNYTEAGNALFLMAAVLATISSVLFILIVLVVKEKPETPPSFAEKSRIDGTVAKLSFRALLKNTNYLLLLVILAFVTSISQATNVVVNQAILSEFKNGNDIVTITGILSIINLIPASFVAGYICQHTKKYKMSLVIQCILYIIFFGLYAYGLYLRNVIMIYVFMFIGSTLYHITVVFGQDFVVEVTYPYPEETTMSIVTSVGQILGLGVIPLVSYMISNFGASIGNLVLVGFGVINLVLAIFLRDDLKRTKANVNQNEQRPLLQREEQSQHHSASNSLVSE